MKRTVRFKCEINLNILLNLTISLLLLLLQFYNDNKGRKLPGKNLKKKSGTANDL